MHIHTKESLNESLLTLQQFLTKNNDLITTTNVGRPLSLNLYWKLTRNLPIYPPQVNENLLNNRVEQDAREQENDSHRWRETEREEKELGH